MEEDFVYIPEKLCRACLQTPNELITIFDKESNDENSISNKILECTTVKIKEAANLPMNICQNCLERLNTAYNFKMMFIQSDEKLRQINTEKGKNVLKTKEFELPSVSPENNNETVDNLNNENIESEVMSAEVYVTDEKEESCNESNVIDSDVSEIQDVTINLTDEMGHTGDDSPTRPRKKIYKKRKTASMESGKKSTIFCKECKKSYGFNYYFDIHLPRHIGEDLYKCQLCDKSFPKSYILKKHILTHEDKKFSCEVCERSFRFAQSLQRHMKKHADTFPHKCHLCEKMYKQISHLQVHLRTHTGERPYVCEICGKGFTSSSNFNSHVFIHSEINEFSCTTCGKSFKTKKTLMAHIKTHSELKPHVCTYCDKQFKSKRVLKRHILIHTGVKPYSCEVCGKTFSQNRASTHMRVHTGEKPYECEICPAVFRYSDNLANHMKKHKTN